YVVQVSRFQIIEETGCSRAISMSGLTIILIYMWPVILPLVSAIFYCPRIVWKFYRHSRDVDAFLRRNGSVDRTRYFRLLAVGCLDILFTLPSGALILLGYVGQEFKFQNHKFYRGWHDTHHDHWAPISVPAAQWRSYFWDRLEILLQEWVYLVLSILIFTIFGLTVESRTTYRRWFWTAAGLLGFKSPVRKVLPDITCDSPPRRRARFPGYVACFLRVTCVLTHAS
ncbi:pheromone A receptor-domain-containing protein, partial [Amylostereum chailletii]